MDQERVFETDHAVPAHRAPPALVRRLLLLAWVALGCAGLMALLPLRYTATTTLAFQVATQPDPQAVRGIAQMLRSREMAQTVAAGLGPADLAQLAGRPALQMPRWLGGTDSSPEDRLLSALTSGLSVSARHNGRELSLAFSATRPRLAARVAEAYAEALTALDASVRTAAAAGIAVPAVRMAQATELPLLPDPPSATAALALLIAGLGLGFAGFELRRRAGREATPRPALPREANSIQRVSWMNAGAGLGLSVADAAERLAHRVRSVRPTEGKAGRLIILAPPQTSNDDLAAACAIALARRLAEDSRVALVALDGESPALQALVSDPRAPGITEMLFGVAGFGETLHREPQSRVHILPPGHRARGGTSVVRAERLPLVLQALRQTYDHVVVAAPAMAGSPGAESVAALSPVLICVEDPAEPATDVETYDALAAQGFDHVVLLRLAADPHAAGPGETAFSPSLCAAA